MRGLSLAVVSLGLSWGGCSSSSKPVPRYLLKAQSWPVAMPDIPYTLAPTADGTKLALGYETPCGKRTLELPMPANARPSAENIVEVEFPRDLQPPVFAHVGRDPEMKGAVKLGAIMLDRTWTNVLGADCGAKLAVDGHELGEVVPPAPPWRDRDHAREESLFVTARTDECFTDQAVVYGHDDTDPPPPRELRGHTGYWLESTQYTVWLTKIPERAEVTTTNYRGAPVKGGGSKTVYALTTCEEASASLAAAAAKQPPAPKHPIDPAKRDKALRDWQDAMSKNKNATD